jgi:hypothetical protein
MYQSLLGEDNFQPSIPASNSKKLKILALLAGVACVAYIASVFNSS